MNVKSPFGIKVFPMVTASHASLLAGYKEREVLQDGKKLAESLIKAYLYYQYDAILVFADVYVEMEAMGGRLRFLTTRPPKVIEYPKKPKLANPKRDGRLPEILKAGKLIKERLPEVPLFVSLKGPFSLAALLMDGKEFMKILIEDKKKAETFLNLAFVNQLNFLKAIKEIPAIPFVGDPFASLVGERIFLNYVLPYLQALAKEAEFSGLHICGETKKLLPHIIKSQAQIISLETDVKYAIQFFAKDQFLMGSVPTSLLLQDDEAMVREFAQKEVSCTRGKNFILSTACDVPRYAKVKNVKVLVEVGRND